MITIGQEFFYVDGLSIRQSIVSKLSVSDKGILSTDVITVEGKDASIKTYSPTIDSINEVFFSYEDAKANLLAKID